MAAENGPFLFIDITQVVAIWPGGATMFADFRVTGMAENFIWDKSQMVEIEFPNTGEPEDAVYANNAISDGVRSIIQESHGIDPEGYSGIFIRGGFWS